MATHVYNRAMSFYATPPANARRLASLAKHMALHTGKAGPFHAVLMTDRGRLPDPVQAAHFLPPGAAIILRDHGPQTENIGESLAALCRKRHLFLLIANDWRLATRLHADGVHLSENAARNGCLAPLLRWRKQERKILSVAAHSPKALARADAIGADLAILAPVLSTKSHPGANTIGVLRATFWISRAALPVLVLGGLSAQTASRLLPSRSAGLAAIGGWTD